MSSCKLPEDCAKQWDILLLLISSEEKKIDRTCENEVDTMNYFSNNEGIRSIMLEWLHQMKSCYAKKSSETDTAQKCDQVSLLWRKKANDLLVANKIEDSYKCYNKSVAYADHTGLMYSMALANRSATLLKKSKFKDCLSDVTQALESGYPMDQRHKLLLRRADCYIELKQFTEAKLTITAATEHSKSLDLPEIDIQEYENHVKFLERKMEILKISSSTNNDSEPKSYMFVNPDFTFASPSIKLCRNDTVGRFVVTTEETRRGDVIFSEEPYAWVTLPSEEPICEMCCDTDINPLPCTQCSRTVYCGSQCRTAAGPAFHQWECVGAQCHLFPTVGIAHLALRVLLLTAHEGFPELPTPITGPITPEKIFQSYSSVDNLEIYKIDTPPFLRMFNLVTNFDKMVNSDYIQYALTATMLTLYLERFTSFFEYLPSRVPFALPGDQLRLFAAALMLRSLGQLVCNGHATVGLSIYPEGGTGRTLIEREVRKATAIYPSAAMMNHSCDPSIINTFYKRRLIVRCARDHGTGDPVWNCYGPHHARESPAARRAQLRTQYMFTCNCDACTDPIRRKYVLMFRAYACQACKGPVLPRSANPCCMQCPATFRLEVALEALERAEDLTQQAKTASNAERRCEKLHAAFKLKQQAWHRHHTSLRAAADKLARLYADVGEYNKSQELIKQNIQSVEFQFGSFSVEVSLELRKLSDVMLQRIVHFPLHPDYREWCLEAHKITKKAVSLMELNYGWWQPAVERLRQRKLLLTATLEASLDPAGDCVHQRLYYNLKI